MTHGSLFAGIGGFDLGFERAGIKTKWMVEIDEYCRKVLASHFPDAKLYGDVTELDAANLDRVDIISAGFPCQDLSVAGKRKGLKGERSGLFFEIVRFLEALRPAWVVLENVPGLLSSKGGRDFAVVLGSLAECGYGVSWRILDSQFFGVPQRRRRVFIVGHLGKPCPPEILFEPESGKGKTQKGREPGQGIAHAVTGRTYKAGDPSTDEYITFDWQSGGDPRLGIGEKPTALHAGQTPAVAYDALNDAVTDKVPTLGQNTGQATGRAGTVCYHAKGDAGEVRISKTSPSLTQRWGTGGGNVPYVSETVDPNGVREASRLPRRVDYPDSPRYRALGNAVTVNVTEWIGRRIMAQVGK